MHKEILFNGQSAGQEPLSGAQVSFSLHLLWLAGMALAVLLVMGSYLIASGHLSTVGFPLDDAWIHQTYARNLALRGEWAFIPGQVSAGSTSPFWSALLALGYLMRINPFAWTFLLDGLSLLGLALVGEIWFRASLSGWHSAIPWAGLFLIGEWHLAWASVSGMETLLFGSLILLTLWLIGRACGEKSSKAPFWGVIGLVIGCSIWVRPDGLTLLGPAVMALALTKQSWAARFRSLAWLAAGVALFLIPYLLFNWQISGSILPNTFYAKQAEYAVERSLPLARRFFDEVTLPLVGSGVFLLPGFITYTWKNWRRHNWAALSAILWFLGYGLLYALRLPVTYQYGRYFMPAMPVFFISGLVGTWELVGRHRENHLFWLFARVGILSGVMIWLIFLAQGAGRYARDVAFIQADMVSPAQWVAANTPSDALVAAHDIGAMGYFSQRRIVDLAGLVSPEVIPFIRDEDRLADWLDSQQVDYLVALSGWYKHLADGKTPVYPSEVENGAAPGENKMIIYRWSQ